LIRLAKDIRHRIPKHSRNTEILTHTTQDEDKKRKQNKNRYTKLKTKKDEQHEL
jgi:hypothetical protein